MTRCRHGFDEASSKPWASSSFLGERRDRLGRAEGGTGGGERHGEQDDEGGNEAFELRRQHQINHDQRQRENDRQRLPGFAEFTRLAVQRGAGT